jgi:hypothetical protein
MTTWKNLKVNVQNIEVETAKAVLIKFPHNSELDGFKFWHPAKLVRNGSHSYEKSIGYTDDFKIKAIKNGNGKYNRFEVIAEKEITIEELEKAFA